jgi:hypothetical protein
MGFQFPPDPEVGQQVLADNGVLYEWDGVKWVVSNWLRPPPEFLRLSGGIMEGPITLADDPVEEMEPVTLQYLIANASRVTTSDEAPENPREGELWWDTGSEILLVFMEDEWVPTTTDVVIVADDETIVGSGTNDDPFSVGVIDPGTF